MLLVNVSHWFEDVTHCNRIIKLWRGQFCTIQSTIVYHADFKASVFSMLHNLLDVCILTCACQARDDEEDRCITIVELAHHIKMDLAPIFEGKDFP